MSATNFKTENNTLRKLIGNGLTYRIPPFQRDYSWKEDEWEDLWLDILGTLKEGGEPAHYMGYLVLQSQDEKSFDVIDGQQRLTTLTLIILAVLKNLQRLIDENIESEKNQRRSDQIRQTYIGYLDPITLISRTKLTLNRNNNDYFQTYLIPLGHLPQRGFRASEHTLRKAFEWFNKRVRDYSKKQNEDEGIVLATLVEKMSDKLFFTVISVTDELNAYKVFETLNARGVRLSSTDLLKNYLFSVLHRENQHSHEMKTLEERWEAMVGRLGSESFPDFLRVHWNSRWTFVRQTELFKTIRTKVQDRAAVFELLRGMEEDMDTYLALTQPDASDWSAELKSYARVLRMFNVRQPFSLLVVAQRKLNGQDFKTLMRSCVMISFRYNVIGSLPTNEQERAYYAAAQLFSQSCPVTILLLLQSLKSVYPKDAAFTLAFQEKKLRTTNSRNSRIVRYILCALEKQAGGQDLEFESNSFNIEHILPQNPQQGWATFSDEEADAMIYRLGNMTLLEKNQNQMIANEEYEIKKPILADSQFKLTQAIAEDNDEWTPVKIDTRQKTMAKLALTVWRVAQLS